MPVARRELRDQGFEGLDVLDAFKSVVLVADAVGERALRVVLLRLRVQRAGRVGIGRGHALDDLLLADPQPLGQLGNGRGPVQLLGQLVPRLGEVEPQLLKAPRHPDRPGGVTEEALDLADDRRHRERGEFHTAVGLEAVDRLDQTYRADLDDVLHRFAAGTEPGRGELHQRQIQLDQSVPYIRILMGALFESPQPGEEAFRQGARIERRHLVVGRDLGQRREDVVRRRVSGGGGRNVGRGGVGTRIMSTRGR